MLMTYSFLSKDKELVHLKYRKIERTGKKAQWVGGKDEELRAVYKVHLTGHFTLAIRNGILFGDTYANFKEFNPGPNHKYTGTDNTEFAIEESHIIYQKAGYKVIDFKILFGTNVTSYFDFKGRNWEQNDIILNGPLTAIHWVGDTDSDQDQINGCFIEPYLKRIDVLIEKEK